MTKNIRNIAVIAHVDHGKTTLVDALLKQSKVFRDNQQEMQSERILDSNDLEKERGITILAKICSIEYQNTHINIIDTPGHADFSGEVERTLDMADGALLIIDAQEGPMPQTRFVLRKALDLNLKIIVVINKIDKKYARPKGVEEKISDLFLELASYDSHLDFTTLYSVGRSGTVFTQLPLDPHKSGSVKPLLNAIISLPSPKANTELPFKMLISSLDYDSHLGRILIGKIQQGKIITHDKVIIPNLDHSKSYAISQLMISKGLDRKIVQSANAGEIVAISGVSVANIGQTVSDPVDTATIASSTVSEPTLHMLIGPNTSPFSGKEGKFTTSRQIGGWLKKELDNNVSLRVEFLSNGKFKVSGRGELHLSVLLETMRREGYELEVGKPEVIIKTIDNKRQEPVEEVNVIVPKEYVGTITQEFGKRLGEMIQMEPTSTEEVEFIYRIPTRAIIGLRSLLATQTKGTALFSSQIIGYQPVGDQIAKLRKGALISATIGEAVEYGLRNLKGRGISFINPATKVYEGMIVGINSKNDDIEINVCKEKHLTNHRSKSHDGITQLAPDLKLSLEQSIDILENDELLEITPLSLRLRKKYLSDIDRRRADRPGLRS